jgi:hypothetical protein
LHNENKCNFEISEVFLTWDVINVESIDREDYFQEVCKTGLKSKLLRFFVVLEFKVQLFGIIYNEFTAVSTDFEIMEIIFLLFIETRLIREEIIVRRNFRKLSLVIFEIAK